MSDLVIGDYDAAVSIDGSTHYLLIQPGNASTQYKKINRNVLLAISGDPVGTTDTQVLTNKTLGVTNTVTLYDSLFTIQDNSDPTKQANFQLSGITAGQTRTLTLPDASLTIVGTATTQTLTNKTLTAPTITNGSITGTAITTNAIVGQSDADSGTIYGISITNAKLSGADISSGTIPTAAIADSAITPAKLLTGTGSTWAWASFTPTWTNITVGSGTNQGYYMQIGKTVFVRVRFVFGAGSAVGSGPTLTLPVTSTSNAYVNQTTNLGSAGILDSGTANFVGYVQWRTTTTVEAVAIGTGSTYGGPVQFSSTVPMTWVANDTLTMEFVYEAA